MTLSIHEICCDEASLMDRAESALRQAVLNYLRCAIEAEDEQKCTKAQALELLTR